jgi:hypothetical protein
MLTEKCSGSNVIATRGRQYEHIVCKGQLVLTPLSTTHMLIVVGRQNSAVTPSASAELIRSDFSACIIADKTQCSHRVRVRIQ